MKKTLFLFILLFNQNLQAISFKEPPFKYIVNHCDIKRPQWNKVKIKLENGKIINGNIRDYIIWRDCKDLVITNNKINKKKTKCNCAYTGKNLFANQLEVDHILPSDFGKKNTEDCKKYLRFFNDTENLVLVESKINNKKSNKIGDINGVDFDIAEIQYQICQKWNFSNCEQIKLDN